jgi:hypothetical protein
MLTTLYNPMRMVADRIAAYYVSHPDLLENLLVRLGAQNVKHRWGHSIECTCPLHGGDNPRGFTLYYDRGNPVWRCFTDTCGKGGLSWLLMKKYPSAGYDQAVVSLGRFCGITVDGSVMHVTKKAIDEETLEVVKRRLGIVTANRQQSIMRFPEEMVVSSVKDLYSPAAAEYLRYLTSPASERIGSGLKCRQIPLHILQQFQIGFVPRMRWVWWNPQEKKDIGWFDDRISFPWRYVDGTLMGFAGRHTMNVDHQKYKTLNGTGRALMLWGLGDRKCLAEIQRTGVVHLVEGYTDVMRGHEHGCHNIAAVGGTELTPEQIKLLMQVGVRCAVTYLDGDGPGRNASESIGRQLFNRIRVMEAVPPADKDPGELTDYREFWTPIVQAKPFTPSRSLR